jgi:hypothetical protein
VVLNSTTRQPWDMREWVRHQVALPAWGFEAGRRGRQVLAGSRGKGKFGALHRTPWKVGGSGKGVVRVQHNSWREHNWGR